MKQERKVETFTYEDLGFPILLIDCPMKKVFGEWILDINLAQLQLNVLKHLINKDSPLTKDELRFIRKYFEMTTTSFGNVFGVTHAAVLKWETGQVSPHPTTEVYIRLFVLDRLQAKNNEFVRLYHKIRPTDLIKKRKVKRSKESIDLMKIHIDELKIA
jgi:DNA-binding transcriptional regulator YiaG